MAQKRFLSATPSELTAMSPTELLSAIRMSEGRIIRAAARIRGANLVDHVTNAELVAAFGADIVNIDTYDPFNPYIPGWASKDPARDEETEQSVQIPLGQGYTFQEISEIVGRPLSILMFACNPEDVERTEQVYGKGIVATAARMIAARRLGVKHICVSGWARLESFTELFTAVRQELGDDLILQFNRPHGPGILNQKAGFKELITEEEIVSFIQAGVNIVGIPAPGSLPGWDLAKCKHYVDLIHEQGALASLGVHTSQEGAFPQTVEQIALYAKMAGADIHDLGDSGYNEQVPDPLNIFHYSMAIRGRRHTYRRMAMSVRR